MQIISFVITFAIFIGILKIISLPFKLIIKLVINSLCAGLVLAALAYFGIAIALNIWIVVLSAILGIPGLVIGIVISLFI